MRAPPQFTNDIELWGGVECTVNRVGNRYHDQLSLSGHQSRLDDLDLVAELGIRTIRYPLLWEKIAPGELEDADWGWADARMKRLDELGITPIVGFVHHGSGPRHTSLLDDQFAPKLAAFARAVAERYPWIQFVTPVNEPLTTARFSALYGHWYPHHKSPVSFTRALLNQCLAIRAAYAAMAEIIPDLRLVQTEDLGKTRSTPLLAYQAAFENDRRWLTFDILCGRVTREHRLWKRLCNSKAVAYDLDSLRAEPRPPDMIGINYYVTSDRFLDDRLQLHPPATHGGNRRHAYADVEAVRVCEAGISGHSAHLRDTWDRYHIPLAVTEVHLGCTREHQIRWLLEAWRGARDARAHGADVRAVTAWALFGSFGWNSLVTRTPFTYEPGAFDVRGPSPRPTGLATAISRLAAGEIPVHPATEPPGWWAEPRRLTRPITGSAIRHGHHAPTIAPILIAGSTGTLGHAFLRIADARGIAARGVGHAEMDLTSESAVRRVLAELRPWAIINAAGYASVEGAESEPHRCSQANAVGPAILAAACAEMDLPLVTFSSDQVFDGVSSSVYLERDEAAPLNVYGRSKAIAETAALLIHPETLVIRTSAFFGPWDSANFATIVIDTLARGLPFVAADDVTVSPTYVPDLVNASLDLLLDDERGIWHLSNTDAVTWADFAREVASRADLSASLIRGVPYDSMGLAAPQPRFSALGSERGSLLPSLGDALDRYSSDVRRPRRVRTTA